MNTELFDRLEKRLESLLREYVSLKQEASILRDENQRLIAEREDFKGRIDVILNKLEGI
jgi:regulator of replication initiation timing